MSKEYVVKIAPLPDMLAAIRAGKLHYPPDIYKPTGRIVIKGGKVVDPASKLEGVKDVAIIGGRIEAVKDEITPEKGDAIISAEGLLVVPGLFDVHMHTYDLFEVTTAPAYSAVAHGDTSTLSPGAGNTLMAPSLLGAEIDRGVPLNIGAFIGAPAILAPKATVEEKIRFFKGEMDEEEAGLKITRNRIVNRTAPLAVGIKDHMGHFILSDEGLDAVIEIADKSGMHFVSHTQCPDHAARVVDIAGTRPVHLGHATAVAFGSHGDPVENMEQIVEFAKKPNVSAEFVSSHLVTCRGLRDGVFITKEAQEVAYDALKKGIVNVVISDGEADATMKGFGDTRDNIPALLELVDKEVLSLSDAIATMTSNPARLLAERTKQAWWVKEIGTLRVGARANVTIIDPVRKYAAFTIVNGQIAGFDGRALRRGNAAGAWITRHGIIERTGVGDFVIFTYKGTSA
jgi:imidazolonepropionase-like amidohydrolase